MYYIEYRDCIIYEHEDQENVSVTFKLIENRLPEDKRKYLSKRYELKAKYGSIEEEGVLYQILEHIEKIEEDHDPNKLLARGRECIESLRKLQEDYPELDPDFYKDLDEHEKRLELLERISKAEGGDWNELLCRGS